MEPILSVKDLSVSFQAFAGTVHAVRDVNFDLMKGETLAIVSYRITCNNGNQRTLINP